LIEKYQLNTETFCDYIFSSPIFENDKKPILEMGPRCQESCRLSEIIIQGAGDNYETLL